MRWQILLMGIVTLAVLALSFILTFRRASAAEMLPLSIQSGQMADYSADNFSSQLAAVDISIIESALKDNRSGNVPEKLATIQSA
ncbi:MAG: hypothetical protein OEY93_07750, partial [Anaerolineae bacterium]|nr:hypothetical protein [Anaerolineae bacterium]